MKRILLFLSTIISISVHAQIMTGPQGYGRQEAHLAALKFFRPPVLEDTICDLVVNSTNGDCYGAIVILRADNFIYQRDSTHWKKIGSGSVDLSNYYTKTESDGRFVQFTDTAGMLLPYLRKGDTAAMLAGYIRLSQKAMANGVATLDAGGKVPLGQIPESLLGAVIYQGTYNAATNTPALPAAATGNKGWYFIVSVAGTQQGFTFQPGDWVISNGSAWGKVDNNNAVTSVFGRVGAVTAQAGDYNTSLVTEGSNLYFTNARARGAISATAPISYNTTTGAIGLDNTGLSVTVGPLTGGNVFSGFTFNKGLVTNYNQRNLTPADISAAPASNGTGYIWNQSATAQTANFHMTAAGYSQTNFTVYKPGSNTIDGALRLTTDVAGTRGAVLQLTAGANPGLATWTHDGSNWGEKMRITADGNVGIGNTTPVSKLTIGTAVAGNNFTTDDIVLPYNGAIYGATSTTNGFNGKIIPFNGSGNTEYRNYFGTGAHIFYTSGGSTNAQSEAARIAPTGNVGIGTNNPQRKLHMVSDFFRLQGLASGASNVTGFEFYDASGVRKGFVGDGSPSNEDVYLISDNGGVRINGGGAENVSVLANGNVGIGNTSPTSKLAVNGAIAITPQVVTTSTTAGNTSSVIIVDGTPVTISFPAAASCVGRVYTIKQGLGMVTTLDPAGTETIDGSATRLMTENNACLTIISDGANWRALSDRSVP